MLKFIKYAALIFFTSMLIIAGYWFFYGYQWGVIIEKEDAWQYSFQPLESNSYEDVQWKEQPENEKITLPENAEEKQLLFRNTFFLEDHTKIKDGILEYNSRYSCRIFINGEEFTYVDRNLILPSIGLEPEILEVHESWRPRKVPLDVEFLTQHLKKGENTITLAVSRLNDLREIKTNKKRLSFLSKGRSNNVKKTFKLRKAKSYFSESKLPIFKIETNGAVILDEPKINSLLEVIDDADNFNQISGASEQYNIKIEVRGNTSQSFSKKSYSINIYDDAGKKKSQEFLGMPSSKKWILYGPYADKSLIRNALTYSIYSQMGNYAPRIRFVDLIINNNFQGIYLLTEKIQIGPNHLGISPLKSNKQDSTKFNGGYILEIDRSLRISAYPPKIDSSANPVSYEIYSPKEKNIDETIKKSIVEQFNVFEQHIYENDSIYDYLDVNSFVDYLIITEFTKNIDGYRLSTFLYNEEITNEKPKFYLGPIWDYNFSFGLTDYNEGYNPEGYVYNLDKYVPFWWDILLKDKTFKNRLIDRYSKLRKTTLSNDNIYSTIDSLSAICASSQEINFKKWDVLGSSDFWPNYYLGKTYQDEINYLKGWIDKRALFLDKELIEQK